MRLALALLRARVAADSPSGWAKDWDWLRTVCPLCLKMIEDSLDRRATLASNLHPSCISVPKS